jgi:hypothetical protein
MYSKVNVNIGHKHSPDHLQTRHTANPAMTHNAALTLAQKLVPGVQHVDSLHRRRGNHLGQAGDGCCQTQTHHIHIVIICHNNKNKDLKNACPKSFQRARQQELRVECVMVTVAIQYQCRMRHGDSGNSVSMCQPQ